MSIKLPKLGVHPFAAVEGNGQHPVVTMVCDESVPVLHRAAVLRDVLNNLNPDTQVIAERVFKLLAANNGAEVYEAKVKEMNELLTEMKEGPCRSAALMARQQNGAGPAQGIAALEDGTLVYVVFPQREPADTLRVGERIVLDAKARTVLGRGVSLALGEVGHIQRILDDTHVLVSYRGNDESVCLAAPTLADQLKEGAASPGCRVIVNARQSLALAVVPQQDGLSHYRFLFRGGVPDVIVARDIGAPPRCIAEVARHVRLELLRPELGRRYGLRRCMMKLLCGVSGSGKTLATQAIHRLMYEIMSEATGVPLSRLPHRVVQVRQSQVLSQWLGESEKNWDRVLDEVEQLADETFTTADGRQMRLPVLVTIEEIDGFGRARGHEAIYDRILSTVLQRLDPNRTELSDRFLIFIATTNTPHLVDPALLRRIGGSIEHFGRLGRRAFRAVLDKLVQRCPAAARNGSSQSEIWRRNIDALTNWLFGANSPDPGLVEITFAGSTTPVLRHRRDFLTGGLVDRAVQQASREACQNELEGSESPGVTVGQLVRAFDDQLRGLVDQLEPHNVGQYTDLPDGARVATLRRIPQPDHLALEFERE